MTGPLLLTGFILCLVQVAAAVPWAAMLDLDAFKRLLRRWDVWGWALGGTAAGAVILAMFLHWIEDSARLEFWGRIYGAALQAQLTIDLFIFLFAVMLKVWPKGGAVALAAFREGLRNPIFWLIVTVTIVLLFFSAVIPYFTFGEDYKFMKLLGFEMIMMAAAMFGVLAAGMSISEEIEGRTAITLMSKPVSRRQFLLGKYVGILLAALALTTILAWCFQWTLFLKMDPRSFLYDWYDDMNDVLVLQLDPILTDFANRNAPEGESAAFARGIAQHATGTCSVLPGLITSFGQVMVLLAIAAALATRFPLIVTVIACVLLYIMSHLAPILAQVALHLQDNYRQAHGGTASDTLELVRFVAGLLETLLPGLEYFNLGPAVIRDKPLPLGPYALYVSSVFAYGLVYTAIALLFGLILFEDRDLA